MCQVGILALHHHLGTPMVVVISLLILMAMQAKAEFSQVLLSSTSFITTSTSSSLTQRPREVRCHAVIQPIQRINHRKSFPRWIAYARAKARDNPMNAYTSLDDDDGGGGGSVDSYSLGLKTYRQRRTGLPNHNEVLMDLDSLNLPSPIVLNNDVNGSMVELSHNTNDEDDNISSSATMTATLLLPNENHTFTNNNNKNNNHPITISDMNHSVTTTLTNLALGSGSFDPTALTSAMTATTRNATDMVSSFFKNYLPIVDVKTAPSSISKIDSTSSSPSINATNITSPITNRTKTTTTTDVGDDDNDSDDYDDAISVPNTTAQHENHHRTGNATFDTVVPTTITKTNVKLINQKMDYSSSFFQNWKSQPMATITTPPSRTTASSKSKVLSNQSLQPSKSKPQLTVPSGVKTTSTATSSSLSPSSFPYLNDINNSSSTLVVNMSQLQEYLQSQGYVRLSDLSPSSTTMAPTTTIGSSSSSSSPSTKTLSSSLLSSTSTSSTMSGTVLTTTSTKSSSGRSSSGLGTTSSSSSSSSGSGSSSTSRSSGGGSIKSGSNTIAFPQKTTMKDRDLKVGCMVCSTVLIALLATTVWPNLWLVGGLAGGWYGSQVAGTYSTAQATAGVDSTTGSSGFRSPTTMTPDGIILYLGRRVTQVYLYLAWVAQTIWFLYKTGQLSLEYYKQYAVMDERFGIQSKLDAMNARFVQAKIDFDAWEKENEIGRKILASLRTAWYIEEQSLAKRQRQAAREAAARRRRSLRRQSKYRLVQYVWNVYDWILASLEQIWYGLTSENFGSNFWKSWQELWNGIWQELREAVSFGGGMEEFGSRLGAIAVAWMAVNAIGALFAISPTLLTGCTILWAMLWPTWMSELYDRTILWMEETKAKGRRDTVSTSSLGKTSSASSMTRPIIDPTWEWIQTVWGGAPAPSSSTSSSVALSGHQKTIRPSSSGAGNIFLFRRYDKDRYHYYRRPDGTKRFYRTGNTLFGRPHSMTTTTSTSSRRSFGGATKSSLSNTKKPSTRQGIIWPWSNYQDDDSNQRKKPKQRRR